MTTPAPTIDSTGIHVPDFDAFKTFLEGSYRTIYGADIVITPDTQDGQLIGVFARAMKETADAVEAAYAARSPKEAKGVGLSSLVKINGIEREVASYSTADVTCVGQASTVITSGVVKDSSGNLWSLPSTVTIPSSGQITVTATCQTLGAIAAPAGTINIIDTITKGWQTVVNNADATVGAAVESDYALRVRQAEASAMPSQTSLDGLRAGVANVSGITRWKIYENVEGFPDETGLPGKSIAVVADGGTLADIAQVLYLKRGQGVAYYGDTTYTITDAAGVAHKMAFSRSRTVPIAWTVRIRPLPGFTYSTMDAIATALRDYTNTAGIAQSVVPGRAFSIVNDIADTFELVSIAASRNGGEPKPDTIRMAYNERAVCSSVADVAVLVLRQNEIPGL